MANLFASVIDTLTDPAAEWILRRGLLAALVVSCLVSFTGVFDHSVWTPDEPRVAEIGREMMMSGDFVVPTLGGEPFLEKPPLYWWVMSGLYRLFGVSDGVARTTSALAGVFLLLLVFDVARRVTDPFTGVMAVVVTATIAKLYHNFHKAIVDPWLALFVMAGYWSFVCYAFSGQPQEKQANKTSELWILVFYLAAGLAFLTKGPIGPILLGGPVAVGVVLGKKWQFLRSWVHIPGACLFLFLSVLWPALLYNRGGSDLLQGFVISNMLNRFLPEMEGVWHGGHKNPFWYYIVSFPPGLMPWLLALPAVTLWMKSHRWPSQWNKLALLFLASIFPVGLVILSIPGTKRGLYLLPLFAPLGIFVAAWLTATARKEFFSPVDRYTHTVLWFFTAVFLCVAVVLALVIYFTGAGIVSELSGTMQFRPSALSFGAHLLTLILALGIVLFFGRRIRRNAPERTGIVAAWAVLGLYVLGAPLLFTLGDGFKNLHGMTTELKQLNAFSPDLVGFRLDETTRAIVPFDTGFMVKNLTETEALVAYCREHPGAKVITLGRNKRRPPEDLLSQLRLVKTWHYSESRIYSLYEILPDTEKQGAPPPACRH